MQKHQTSPPERMLSFRELQQRSSLSRATIYREIWAGRHPAPVPLTPGGARVGFRESEVNAWLQDPLGWSSRNSQHTDQK